MTDTIKLMREYVRVADMCDAYNKDHGSDVKPWECVKFNGYVNFTGRHPSFDRNKEYYEFAIAILEGLPVFVGDKLFEVCSERYFKVDEDITTEWINTCTWTPPTKKRTFTIGGRTLPVPLKPDGKIRHTVRVLSGSYERHFDFETNEDAMCFSQGICDQVTAARDKE